MKRVVGVSVAVLLLVMPAPPTWATTAEVISPSPASPGAVSGTGSTFALSDTLYRDVTLTSSVPVTAFVESVPDVVTIALSAGTETETVLTLAGLAPDTTYHLVDPIAQTSSPMVSSAEGSLHWRQGLAAPSTVFVQPARSTTLINAGSTNQCSTVGAWDAATRTCALNRDVADEISVVGSAAAPVTLDAAGHRITPPSVGSRARGVTLSWATLKNATVAPGFTDGISIAAGTNAVVNTTATGSMRGAFLTTSASLDTRISGSTLSGGQWGVFTGGSKAVEVRDSTLSGGGGAVGLIAVQALSASTVTLFGNSLTQPGTASPRGSIRYGALLNFWKTGLVTRNTLHATAAAAESEQDPSPVSVDLEVNRSSVTVTENDFVGTGIHARQGQPPSPPSSFTGNFWSQLVGTDVDHDGRLDAPYLGLGVRDDAAWAVRSGWTDITPPTVTCPSTPRFQLNSTGAVVAATVTDTGTGVWAGTVTALVDTSTVGTKSVAMTGYDRAGNATTISCRYDVGYVSAGFSAPIDLGVLNVAKAGQALPLKWRLLDANGVPVVTLSGVTVKTRSLTCQGGAAADAVEEYAAGSSGLQNLGDGYYQFNWKSPTSYARSCRAADLYVGSDPQPLSADFHFTR